MCRIIEIQRDVVPANISIEFQRDAPLRATEVIIINKNPSGEEYGVVLMCADNGKITVGKPMSITEGARICLL